MELAPDTFDEMNFINSLSVANDRFRGRDDQNICSTATNWQEILLRWEWDNGV